MQQQFLIGTVNENSTTCGKHGNLKYQFLIGTVNLERRKLRTLHNKVGTVSIPYRYGKPNSQKRRQKIMASILYQFLIGTVNNGVNHKNKPRFEENEVSIPYRYGKSVTTYAAETTEIVSIPYRYGK